MAYARLPSFVLGFHGCDEDLKRRLILKETTLKPSENDYDWLGSGIYFWENDPDRALSWAKSLAEKPVKNIRITTPAVVGAVIDLGFCLNLFEEQALLIVRESYELLRSITDKEKLPKNTGENLFKRNLDCAVLKALHTYREDKNLQPYDSIRAPFWEGKELYPNSGFKDKNHIQLCIRDPKCIKGYFDPINIDY